jgi:hypothetical protein
MPLVRAGMVPQPMLSINRACASRLPFVPTPSDEAALRSTFPIAPWRDDRCCSSGRVRHNRFARVVELGKGCLMRNGYSQV